MVEDQGGSMIARTIVAIVASVTLAAAVPAQESGAAKPKIAQKVAGQPVVLRAAELKWTDLDPVGAPGVKVVDLWGDHRKGAFGAYFKLPAGFAVPLHTHTRDMKLVFIS